MNLWKAPQLCGDIEQINDVFADLISEVKSKHSDRQVKKPRCEKEGTFTGVRKTSDWKVKTIGSLETPVHRVS